MVNMIPHILLVDDDTNLLQTLGDILKFRGFEPVLAQTGGAALEYIQGGEIDVALIDLKLEDMPGLDVLHGIKARAPDCECILLTGNASQDSAIRAVQMGAYGYFQKPFEVEQILLSIQRAADKHQITHALRASEEKFRTVADFTYDWEFWLDPQQQFIYISPACERVSGYSVQEFFNDATLIRRIIYPEDLEIWDQHLSVHGGEESPNFWNEITFRIIRRDGEIRWVEHGCRAVHGADGKHLGWRASNRDVTERKRTEEALEKRDRFTESLIQSSAVATFVIDAEHKVLYWNKACEDLTAIQAKDLIGTSDHWKAFYDHHRPCMADIIVDHKIDDMALFYEIHARSDLIPDGISAEGWYPNLGGKNRYILFDAAPIYDDKGKLVAAIETIKDITVRKQVEEELQRAKGLLESAHRELQQSLEREQLLAHTDDLTDLYNRRYFYKLAAREFSASMRYRRPLSIIIFDVDGFKRINDSFGHLTGDKALALVAQIASTQVRASDVLARYGGDEFVILLSQTGAQQALSIAERINASTAATLMETDKGNLSLTLSIGIAELNHALQDESVESVIRRADEAMYAAKQAGQNRTVIHNLRTGTKQ
jgi:diguanylate cyclase (GGDEF)-like protein/PAS domain S-box-containing protein